MYLGVIDVKPLSGYHLQVTFENNEIRYFDVSPYLDKGVFSDLREEKQFRSVHISFDTIEWSNGADMDPEILYSEGKKSLPQSLA